MCGIVGVASTVPVQKREWVSVGAQRIRHRGPDDSGEWWSLDSRVGLAHRRLSVIDLSQDAHQPMVIDSGRYAMVYNGEIYNFKEIRDELIAKGQRFVSRSDTEVVLTAYKIWGEDCLSRFNGMFSFAIYDSKRKIVFLARDRAGEKPLFYHYSNGVLHFASELKAILSDSSLDRRIDKESLDCYLSCGYVPGKGCILQGFNKLPPAHAATFNLQNDDFKLWSYWQLPDYDQQDVGARDQETYLLDELEALLEDSVRRQMVSDVPVGILLSGGVDSSLVTAMAVRSSSKVKTFSVGFPGFGKLDERPHARLIANHFGTDHTELVAEPASADLVPQLACQFDEPVVDSSMIPSYLVSQLVRKHCKVAIGGDGGDELFGGYGRYNRLVWMEKQLKIVPLRLRQAIAANAEEIFPVGLKGRNWLQWLGINLENALPLFTLFDSTTRMKLMRHHHNWSTSADDVMSSRIPLNVDVLQRATRMDFYNFLAEDILVKVDRTSMLNSLEMRSPLLDYRLIEFAYGKVPSYLKSSPRHKKKLLKELTVRLLPQNFDRQRKQGFSIPLAQWLNGGSFRNLFRDVLFDPNSIFDHGIVDRLLKRHDQNSGNSERLFSLVLFELWRKEYCATL